MSLLLSKQNLLIGISILTVFLVMVGFNEKQRLTNHCSSVNTIYMNANFSEIITGIDFEGQYYSEVDSWSERVSTKYFTVMYNSKITEFNSEYFIESGVAYPVEDFEYDKSIVSDHNFDNFTLKRMSNIRQYFTNGEYVKIDKGLYEGCYLSIGQPVSVKYWYNLAYGI